jgi:signal transduction histidine kinase
MTSQEMDLGRFDHIYNNPATNKTLETTLRQAVELLVGVAGWMDICEPEMRRVRFLQGFRTHIDHIDTTQDYGTGAGGFVAQSGEPLILSDYASWHLLDTDFAEEAADRQLLSVPMIHQDEIRGVIHVLRDRNDPEFNTNDVDTLGLLAHQGAIEIEKANLLHELEAHAVQMSRLNDLTHAAMQASDLKTLVAAVSSHMGSIINADRCQIALWDERRGMVVPASHEREVEEKFAKIPAESRGRTLTQVVLEGGDVLAIDDVHDTPHIDPQMAASLPAKSMLALPLIVGETWIGAALLGFTAHHQFTPNEIGVCKQAAAQIAFALVKMRALEESQMRSDELEALRKASLSITSNLDLETVLSSIAAFTLDLVRADDIHIFLFDGVNLRFGAAHWPEEGQGEPFIQPREDGLTYSVARSGERIVVPHVDDHPLFKDWHWGGAIVGIPLKIREKVVGVMNVALDAPHDFDDAELRVMGLFADQAAIMIENAGLFQSIVEERSHVELLYDLAQELANTLDADVILNRALALTVENLDAKSGAISLIDRENRSLQEYATIIKLSDSDADHDAINKAIFETNVMERVVESHEALLVSVFNNGGGEARWHSTHPEIKSAVGSPILSDEEVIGVMAIFHDTPGYFHTEHVDILIAITQHISLALSNARRYQQIERRFAEMNLVRQVVQVVNRRLEMQPLLKEVVNQVAEVLGYPVVEIYLVDEDSLVLGAARGGLMDTTSIYPFSRGVIGRAVISGEAIYVPDVKKDMDYLEAWPETQSEIAVPLMKEGVVIGVLNVESPQLGGVSEDDVRILALLADQLSIAVENAALYERLCDHADELQTVVAERTAELASALEQARAADRLKTQFVSDVSHELRTPLSNIRLYLDLLSRGPTERFEAYMETLSRETDRLVALIEDLLAISRMDAGTITPEPVEVNLNVIAKGLVDDRCQLYADRELDLYLNMDEELPSVLADEKMISQVIANLMTNAMHYTPPGGEIVITTRQEHGDDQEWVTLIVEDTGLGIPDAERSQIFERFFRGTASRTMKVSGTGLGLAISKEILDRHQGKITLSSNDQERTAFTIWLPLEDQSST